MNIKEKTFEIGKIEVIPSQIEEIEVSVVKKNIHGKKTVTKEKKLINKKMDLMSNKLALSYFERIKSKIYKHHALIKLKKKQKLKGTVKTKIQIQASGRYDVLSMGGTILELNKLAQRTYNKIRAFPPIPEELEQSEIQLIIPFRYQLSK